MGACIVLGRRPDSRVPWFGKHSMGFIDTLLGRRPDLTKDWPTTEPFRPAIDVVQIRFGPLSFGDPLDAASFLGRPSRFTSYQNGLCALLYAKSGFEIEFHRNRFASIAFLLGPDKFLPDHADLSFADVELKGAGFDGRRLNSGNSKTDLIRQFGTPAMENADDSEVIMLYERGTVTMEFELNLEDRLKRWNIFPTDEY